MHNRQVWRDARLARGNGRARCHFQRSTLCRLATDSERFARRRCRAKAPNNDQAPSLANRLRSFANESAGCLSQMPHFFFPLIMCWFLFDGWRRAVLDSARELFTNPCKRNPPAPNSVCRAKTLNNHQAPSLANRLRRFANESAEGLVTNGQ